MNKMLTMLLLVLMMLVSCATAKEQAEYNLQIRVGGVQVSISGAHYDRSVLEDYMWKNIEGLKQCYIAGKDSRLFGKIVIHFIIAETGVVSKSVIKKTTMDNKIVEDCIVQRIKNIRFPQPEDGGVVKVNFPLIFNPGPKK